MNLHWIDWTIVGAMLAFITFAAIKANRHTRGVADFLAANRCAGRYLISVSDGIAALAAISIIAYFENYYNAGFAFKWWYGSNRLIIYFVTAYGWVIYRFRQTRALTMAQFFEMRYSKAFRIWSGMLVFCSGLINFGIFPAVGARFMVYFCGFPAELNLPGFAVSTYAVTMFFLLSLALFFTFFGGQISVMITDFFQGMFCNIVFLIILIFIFWKFPWSSIAETLMVSQPGESLVNPFDTGKVKDFNFWFFAIGTFGFIYQHQVWPSSQGYNAASSSPHEAKMAKIVGEWRGVAQALMITLLAVCAYVIMHNPKYIDVAVKAKAMTDAIDSSVIKSQMSTPAVLAQILPVGLLGSFCAVMLAAFIGSSDTQLHSWGSVFIQDVILPIRKKPFTPKGHIWALRFSIVFVAVFVYLFSLFYKQSQYIMMFTAITGSIYVGGAGAVVIGGLYWKKGTTAAAWSASITGAVFSVSAILVDRFAPDYITDKLPNFQVMWFFAMVLSIVVYVVVSLLTCKKAFNMDKLLHKGQYAVKTDKVKEYEEIRGFRKLLGITKEFSKFDRVMVYLLFGNACLNFGKFVVISLIALAIGATNRFWLGYWHYDVVYSFVLGFITTVWFAIGGMRDLFRLFKDVDARGTDDSDDGTVDENADKNEQSKNTVSVCKNSINPCSENEDFSKDKDEINSFN